MRTRLFRFRLEFPIANKQSNKFLACTTPFCSCQNVMNVSVTYFLPDFILCVKSSDLPPLGPDPGTTSCRQSVLLLPFILATFQSVIIAFYCYFLCILHGVYICFQLASSTPQHVSFLSLTCCVNGRIVGN